MNARSLPQLCEEHLAAANDSHSGRSAVTIFGGQEHDMRQTLIALSAGAALHEHEAPREATLQVLDGHVQVNAGQDAWEGHAGDYLEIPRHRHDLQALTDAVVLLTVATRG